MYYKVTTKVGQSYAVLRLLPSSDAEIIRDFVERAIHDVVVLQSDLNRVGVV